MWIALAAHGYEVNLVTEQQWVASCTTCAVDLGCPRTGVLFAGWVYAWDSGLAVASSVVDGRVKGRFAARPWHTSQYPGDEPTALVGALCAPATAPIALVEASGLLEAVATCPPDSFAIAGGYRATGDDPVTASARTGLFAPTGWLAAASGEVVAQVACAPLAAALVPRTEPVDARQGWSWTTPEGLYSKAEVYAAGVAPAASDEQPALPIAVSVVLPAAPLGLAGIAAVPTSTGWWAQADAANTDPAFDAAAAAAWPSAALSWVAPADRDSFDAAMTGRAVTAGPGWLGTPSDLPFDAVGLRWLPAEGDALPPSRVLEALPVAITGQISRAAVAASLDAPVVLTSEVSDTLGAHDITLVEPDDPLGAVAWLSEHRAALSSLDHPTVVFLPAESVDAAEAQWSAGPPPAPPDAPCGCGAPAGGGGAAALAWLTTRRARRRPRTGSPPPPWGRAAGRAG